MKPYDVGQFLTVDPGVCHGKLTFKGTRVPVETVLYFISQGRTIDKILLGWPYLQREAIAEAIQLASAALAQKSRAKAKRRVPSAKSVNGNIRRRKPTQGSASFRRNVPPHPTAERRGVSGLNQDPAGPSEAAHQSFARRKGREPAR